MENWRFELRRLILLWIRVSNSIGDAGRLQCVLMVSLVLKNLLVIFVAGQSSHERRNSFLVHWTVMSSFPILHLSGSFQI